MKKLFLAILLLATPLLWAANYTLVDAGRSPSRIDKLPKGTVADMKQIPQDPAYYAKQLKPIPYSRQLKWDKEFNKKYFSPWKMTSMNEPIDEMKWPFRSVTKRKIYDSRNRVIPPSVYKQWIRNANFSRLDTVRAYAITTRHTDLRALPTRRPFYHDPKRTGEGFPFDYNQNSSYHINTPLYISHYSIDRKWAYVHGPTAYGWVQRAHIALVDRNFIKKFKNGRYAVVVKDNLKLYKGKKPITIVKLGTIFPESKANTKKVKHYLFAARSKSGKAVIQAVQVKKKGLIAKKPIPMTPKNTAMIARQFYNEPYGWGGMLETRDCSSFTKDYFAPFGIFLRRNSSKQARDGSYCTIRGIPKEKKKKTIISKAKPFQSMLYVPGHIVLYLGQYKGEPVIMHTYWGARLKDGSKKVLARTVITTTEPGKELKNIKERSKLANTLKAIITPGE
jgi:hypothetical protein